MNFLKKNFGLKLMALIISLVVWTYVESQALIQDHADVPFEVFLTGLPSDLTATVVGKTTVEAKGSPDIIKDIKNEMLGDFSAHKLQLVVDMSRAQSGTGIDYSASFARKLPYDGVTWERPLVRVLVEEKHQRRGMKIRVEGLLLPQGMTLNGASTTVNPPKANVSGRQVDINKVDHLSVQIQIQQYDPNKVLQNVVVQPKDAANQNVAFVEVDPQTVDVHPSLIEANGKRNVLISVPIHGQLAPGFELESFHSSPTQTLISGQQEDVGQVQSLTTSPINLGDLKEGVHSFKVRILQPKDNPVEMDDRFVKVTVSVKTYATKTPPAPSPASAKSTTQVIPPSVLAH